MLTRLSSKSLCLRSVIAMRFATAAPAAAKPAAAKPAPPPPRPGPPPLTESPMDYPLEKELNAQCGSVLIAV